MRLSRQNLVSLFLIGAAFALSAYLYTRLPDPVPTHWNLQGEADGFTPKPWGAFVLPLAMVGVMLLFLALPKISPRGYEIGRFQGVFEILQTAFLGFLLLVHALEEPVRVRPVASAARPTREWERRKTARRRSRATPHKRFFEHSARSESIAGAQQGITRTAS